jgi:N-carbamoyl-L-amino-acid hydrolase
MAHLEELGEIGRADGACHRLALTDEDKLGRDRVVSWMKELGLAVRIDRIGNIVGMRAGTKDAAPVMTGSHIDTVATGGKFDGNLGVLAALEAVQTLNEAGIATPRPVAVAVFTDEEGSRIQPDMLGSLVYAAGMRIEDALALRAIDGPSVGDELKRIGYDGEMEPGEIKPSSFVELHIEQGPILDKLGESLGAVIDLQGISWQEVTIRGCANHAGTTPMEMRRDSGYGAGRLACFVHDLALSIGGKQVGTVGSLKLKPNLVNVIPQEATVTVDLRNNDNRLLLEAERRLSDFLSDLSKELGLEISSRRLSRFDPVVFDESVVRVIEASAASLGEPIRRMTSGAGQDAQMFARICPTAMIFVPSIKGISHNPEERTSERHVELGANVLLRTLLSLAEKDA